MGKAIAPKTPGWWQARLIDKNGSESWSAPKLLTLPVPGDNDSKDTKDDWLGKKSKKTAPQEIVPQSVGLSAFGPRRVGQGFDCVPLTFKVKDNLPNPLWLEAGKSFLLQDSALALHRISFPEGIELSKLEAGHIARSFSLTKFGIMTVITDVQEIWLLDPATLAINKRIKIPDLQCAGTTSGASDAWAAGGKEIFKINLEQGSIIGQWKLSEIAKNIKFNFDGGQNIRDAASLSSGDSIAWILPTPSSQHILIGDSSIFKIRIDKKSLSFEEKIPRSAMVGISNDGRYLSSHNMFDCIDILSVDDLYNPVLRIANTGFRAKAVGLDKAGHRIIVCEDNRSIVLYDSIDGKRLKQLDSMKEEDGQAVRISMRSDGGAFIVVTEKLALVVTLNDKSSP